MPLQTSGQISLNDIHVEIGGTTSTEATINDEDIRGMISKAAGTQNAFNEYYGAAGSQTVTISNQGSINGQANYQQASASGLGLNNGDTLEIPANFWVWSDSTSTAALVIDRAITVNNYGKIIGKGGKGGGMDTGTDTNGTGQNGGPAINVTVSGVTINNYSGAYIAGGGGGGGAGDHDGTGSSNYPRGGGGGGAGGGASGPSASGTSIYDIAAGGVLNAAGASSVGSGYGQGGGAGGGGGNHSVDGYGDQGKGGGGGGRILPGSGGTGGNPSNNGQVGGNGGSGGSAGSNGTYNAPWYQYSGGGGGGGWGAAGGTGGKSTGTGWSGGSGGAAITGSSRTLSNSGTIYGST